MTPRGCRRARLGYRTSTSDSARTPLTQGALAVQSIHVGMAWTIRNPLEFASRARQSDHCWLGIFHHGNRLATQEAQKPGSPTRPAFARLFCVRHDALG